MPPRKWPSWFHLVIPCAILISASMVVWVGRSQVEVSAVHVEKEALIVQPSVADATLLSPRDVVEQAGTIFSKSKHLTPDESLRILTDLGNYDTYNGGALRCNTDAYRQPELYWYDYSSAPLDGPLQFNATRRLLIVQSAGFGTYAQLLDLTAPINKAYARKWRQTMLVLQGTLVFLEQERKTNCPPPEHRSTHNKMQLLKFALHLRDHYDYLLILDADAMIYDFALDLSDLMPPRAMMAANRVIAKPGVKKRATWKINAGVTLWNLHHKYTAAVADGWTQAAVGFMNGRNNNPGDQLFLYHVLKNNASMEENVYSMGKEFNYNQATAIKHVKRPHVTYEIGQTSLDSRSEVIQKFTDEICAKFPTDCRDLDKTIYSDM